MMERRCGCDPIPFFSLKLLSPPIAIPIKLGFFFLIHVENSLLLLSSEKKLLAKPLIHGGKAGGRPKAPYGLLWGICMPHISTSCCKEDFLSWWQQLGSAAAPAAWWEESCSSWLVLECYLKSKLPSKQQQPG